MNGYTVGDLKKLIKGLPNDMPLFEADNDGHYFDGELPEMKRVALDTMPNHSMLGYYGPHENADGKPYLSRKTDSDIIVEGLVFGGN